MNGITRLIMDYVPINPIKHGLVARVADWPYSIFHRYVGLYPKDWAGKVPDPQREQSLAAEGAALFRPTRYLTKIDLPKLKAKAALDELRLMGITEASLFPGLDGICRALRDRFFQ